jgi:hypothetical protein
MGKPLDLDSEERAAIMAFYRERYGPGEDATAAWG